LLKKSPFCLLLLPFWLLRGKATLKSEIARRVSLDVETLPYNKPLIQWLQGMRAKGARLVLCTAADNSVASDISKHLGIFDDVIASDGHINNASVQKRSVLDKTFGYRGYDYAGNASADLAVWAGAREAIVVNASARVVREAARISTVTAVFAPERVGLSQWARALRLHQWLKNLLVFVPLLAAHQLHDSQLLQTLVLAFLAFGLCASSVYIANDLLDLDSDRQHPRKRFRSFASGALPLSAGVLLAPFLLTMSLLIAALVGKQFLFLLFLYFLLTCVYSLWLKRLVLIDCLLLAGLYTLRIIAGAAAVAIALSFWLLAFSIFIFFSLAFVKRYAELRAHASKGSEQAQGRGYQVSDGPLLQTMGVASGYASVLVLALYLHGETVTTLYSNPEMIWIAVPLLLLWISWVWLKAHRGEMHDDPVVFAVRDPMSLLVATLLGGSFILASIGIPS
jgi:4-hydroxybenzoate polyprenyltransferase